MIGFDTETHLIRRGNVVPRLVCLTVHGPDVEVDAVVRAGWPGGRAVVRPGATPGTTSALLGGRSAVAAARVLLDHYVVAHRAAYDLAVLAHAAGCVDAVFRAVHERRVVDTYTSERLIRIALGELEYGLVPQPSGPPEVRRTPLDLAGLVRRYHGVELSGKAGPDVWRLRYAELDGVPVNEWPEAAIDYAIGDAVWAYEVDRAQVATYPREIGGYPSAGVDGRPIGWGREVEAAWCYHLWAAWGVRTDPARVLAAVRGWDEEIARGREVAARHGWVRPNGTVAKKALQAAVEAALGADAPRTKPTATYPQGQVKVAADVLELAGGDLGRYGATLGAGIVRSRWAGPLLAGTARAITSSPETPVETGRTSWKGPPWQQPPRTGGVREAVVPRPGCVFVSVDYDVAELCALAQVCLWAGLGSSLAAEINAGHDPHTAIVAELMGISYARAMELHKAKDPRAEELRVLAKALNFGLPGGLGADAFVGYAAGYGAHITRAAAVDLIETWHRARPEVRAYFRWVEQGLDSGVVQHPVSGRLRGGVRYTSACNGYFQGLVADGAKYASAVLTSCWYGVPHPDLGDLGLTDDVVEAMAGSRGVLFLHDEVIAEVPRLRASDAGEAMSRIMVAAMSRHIPDVRVRAEPALMTRWSKSAKSTRDEHGRWSVWEE